jgi:hypothetical protein
MGSCTPSFENGVSLTGMPTWRNAQRESSGAIWNLGVFIRSLRPLTRIEFSQQARAHTSSSGQSGKRVRGLPYAEDRNRRRSRCLRACANVPFHGARDEGSIQDSQSMYNLPRGEIDGVGRGGDEPLAGVVAMEDSIDAFKTRKTLRGRVSSMSRTVHASTRPFLQHASARLNRPCRKGLGRDTSRC